MTPITARPDDRLVRTRSACPVRGIRRSLTEYILCGGVAAKLAKEGGKDLKRKYEDEVPAETHVPRKSYSSDSRSPRSSTKNEQQEGPEKGIIRTT